MNTLKVILKQHTPLIHFQHEQCGATLRASEVKPKLDRFLIDKLGGIDKIKKDCHGWLVGKGEHPSLDYKMRIEAEKPVEGVKLKSGQNPRNRKWNTLGFPENNKLLILTNMGGKDTEEELVNFSMHESITMTLNCKYDGMLEELKKNIPLFFSTTNFGQRQNKGFGSFTIRAIQESGRNIPFANSFKEEVLNSDHIENIDNVFSLNAQKILFLRIYEWWRMIKGNYTMDVIKNPADYIDGMKNMQKKIDKGSAKIDRFPTPIIFKPIYDEEKECFRIYIMRDWSMLSKMKEKFQDGDEIAKGIKLYPSMIDNLEEFKDLFES